MSVLSLYVYIRLYRDRVQDLTNLHVKYGVELQHYEVLQDCLISVLQSIFKDSWTDRDHQAWNKAFSVITHCAKKSYAK